MDQLTNSTIKAQEYKDKAEQLDLIQRKASLLIQGVSFFTATQGDNLLRDILVKKYKDILEKLNEVEI